VDGGAQEKRKTGWNSGNHQMDGFLSFTLRWMLMYFFAGFFFESHPGCDFWGFFPQNMANFVPFFPKKKTPLCTLCKGIFILIFLGCHCVKFHQEKCTSWETYCHFIFLSLGFHSKACVTLVIFQYLCPKPQAKWWKGLHTTEWNYLNFPTHETKVKKIITKINKFHGGLKISFLRTSKRFFLVMSLYGNSYFPWIFLYKIVRAFHYMSLNSSSSDFRVPERMSRIEIMKWIRVQSR